MSFQTMEIVNIPQNEYLFPFMGERLLSDLSMATVVWGNFW